MRKRDRLIDAREWLGWCLLLVLALAVRETLARHTAIYDVDVQSGWLNFVISAIVALAGWIGGHAATIGIVLWEVLQKVGIIIAQFAVKVAGVMVQVYNLFGRFWAHVLRPFVSWSWRSVLRLEGWLQRTFNPVLRFLQLVRTRLLEIYTKWFRPIFDTIDAVRGVLRVLGSFHIKWALALDAKLGDLEDRMLAPIRLALAKINEASDWINRIVTFDGLFQRLTLLASLWHHVGDVWGVLLSHNPEGTSAAANAAAAARAYPADDPALYTKALNDWYRSKSGILAPQMSAHVVLLESLTVF